MTEKRSELPEYRERPRRKSVYQLMGALHATEHNIESLQEKKDIILRELGERKPEIQMRLETFSTMLHTIELAEFGARQVINEKKKVEVDGS